jgi:hypothetical protein
VAFVPLPQFSSFFAHAGSSVVHPAQHRLDIAALAILMSSSEALPPGVGEVGNALRGLALVFADRAE